MTLPPLRTGICTIGPARYPAIVGRVEGDDREIFVCGVHIDFFLSRAFPSLPEAMKQHVRIDAGGMTFDFSICHAHFTQPR